MRRAVIVTVKGKVQRVGYRRYVLDIAQEEGVAGEARNQPDGSVRVFAQGKDDSIASFLRKLRTPSPPAVVKEVQERKARPRAVKGFRMVSGGVSEEMQEGFGAMQAEFSAYRGEFRGFASRTDKNFRDLGGKFDGFAGQTDANFRAMDTKYGEISEKLSQILSALADQAKRSEAMVESMRNEARETASTLNESLRLLKEAVGRLPTAN